VSAPTPDGPRARRDLADIENAIDYLKSENPDLWAKLK
jgi:hypothetical protein